MTEKQEHIRSLNYIIRDFNDAFTALESKKSIETEEWFKVYEFRRNKFLILRDSLERFYTKNETISYKDVLNLVEAEDGFNPMLPPVVVNKLSKHSLNDMRIKLTFEMLDIKIRNFVSNYPKFSEFLEDNSVDDNRINNHKKEKYLELVHDSLLIEPDN